MAEDIASLGIRIDSSQVEKGTQALDKLTVSAEKAAVAESTLQQSAAKTGEAVAAQTRSTQQAATIGATLAAKHKELAGATAQQTASMQAAGLSAKQYGQAMRLLPAQITDIVTSLASGQPAYLVAIQQGGQLRDSFGGIGNALKALGSVLTPIRIALGGVAAAVGILVKANIDASRESRALTVAIAQTGNAAGVTRSQLREMAEELSKKGGTESGAASALAIFVSTAVVARENLKDFVSIAQDLEKYAGTPIKETAKRFAELGRSPVEASKKLNDQLNYLTIDVYRQIQALEDQGDAIGAARLAQEAYAAAEKKVAESAKEDVGAIEYAWIKVKEAISGAGSAIVGIGREGSDASKLRELAAERQRILTSTGGKPIAGLADRVKQIDQETAAIKRRGATEQTAAEATRKSGEETQRKIELEKTLAPLAAANLDREVRLAQSRQDAASGQIRRGLSGQLSVISAQDAALDALRQADLLKASEYTKQKIALIHAETAAREKALKQQNYLLRDEARRIDAAAKLQISGIKGVDREPERIRVRTEADAQILAVQEQIKDNEQDIQGIRQQGSTQELQQKTESIRATNEVLRALEDETDELELQAQLGDKAADAIERLRRANALDRAGGDKNDPRIREAQANVEIARVDTLLARQREELRLLGMTDKERDREIVLRNLSASATASQTAEITHQIDERRRLEAFKGEIGAIHSEFPELSEETRIKSAKELYAELEYLRNHNLISEEQASEAEKAIHKKAVAERMKAAHTLFGGLESLAITKNKTLFRISKAAAIANATVSGIEGIQNAFATKPWFLGLAQGIAASAILYSNISAIRQTEMTGFMEGGFTGNMPATQIAGVVHGREWVANAGTTSRVGVDRLNALQEGRAQIMMHTEQAARERGAAPELTVTVINNNGSKVAAEQISRSEVTVMINDQIQKQTPNIVAGQISQSNSTISKSINSNLQAPRRR